MKIIIIVTTIASLAYGGWYIYNRPQPHTVDEFITYLNTNGLEVKEASISAEAEKFIGEFKTNYNNLQKAVGADTTEAPNQPKEGGLYSIGGIKKAEINHYSSLKEAKLAYQEKLSEEQRIRDKVPTNLFHPGVYFMTEHLQAGTFIITIRHFDVNLKDGKIDISSKHKLNLPAEDLAKLRTAVVNWKE